MKMGGSTDAEFSVLTMQLTTNLRAEAKMEAEEESLEEELARELAALRAEDVDEDLPSLIDENEGKVKVTSPIWTTMRPNGVIV